MSTDTIKQAHFENIIDNVTGEVKILTGTHGNVDGGFDPEIEFFNSDFARWGSQSNVKILNITKMTEEQIAEVVNSNSTIVCAWCYSERSTVLLKALGLIK